MCTANGIKIMCQGSLGHDMSEIREGKTVATSDFVTAFGDIFKSCPIDPNGGCHHGKVHVIHDCIGIAGLAFAAPGVLFDLFETGFNFPPCAIVLDDLRGGQIEISREKGDPLCFTKDLFCFKRNWSFPLNLLRRRREEENEMAKGRRNYTAEQKVAILKEPMHMIFTPRCSTGGRGSFLKKGP